MPLNCLKKKSKLIFIFQRIKNYNVEQDANYLSNSSKYVENTKESVKELVSLNLYSIKSINLQNLYQFGILDPTVPETHKRRSISSAKYDNERNGALEI